MGRHRQDNEPPDRAPTSPVPSDNAPSDDALPDDALPDDAPSGDAPSGDATATLEPAGSSTGLPAWADEPTVLVAGPGSPAPRGPRTRSLVLVGGATMAALILFTAIIAMLPGEPPAPPGPTPSTVDTTFSTMEGIGVVTGAPPAPPNPTATVSTTLAASPGPSRSTTANPSSPTTAQASAAQTSPGQTSGAPTSAAPTGTTTAPPVSPGVTGTYSVNQQWFDPNSMQGGFIARVVLANPTGAAKSWRLVLEFPGTVNGYVTGWSNAATPPTIVATARTATVTGQAALGAGQSVEVYVQFSRTGTSISPTRCEVNATTCA